MGTVSEWRAPASQYRAAVSGETHPHRTQAIVQLKFLVITGLAVANSQLSSLQSPSLAHRRKMAESDPKKAGSIYEFSATDIDGNQVSLEKYKGHVCIIVNVASK